VRHNANYSFQKANLKKGFSKCIFESFIIWIKKKNK